MTVKVFTIGVYGFDEDSYFNALLEKDIDTFCDIRSRRGMRGKRYAFVNSTYLQSKLSSLGIEYLHFKNLAPSDEIRAKQKQADQQSDTTKQKRTSLSDAFISSYRGENLSQFDAQAFLTTLGEDAKNVVLFCVEQNPDACHRSLLAKHLNSLLGLEVEHIV